jgi:hypothetical protein
MKFFIPLLFSVLTSLPAAAEPAAVRIQRTPQGGFQLLRNGKPYFINGGALRYIDKLVAAGGNSVRSWGPATDLDSLHASGLTILFGLPVGKPRQGFDYTGKDRVARQHEAALGLVRKHKDHPALLMWALGNESELNASQPDRVRLWQALEEMAKAIKQIDPNHPVITVLAGAGRLDEVKQYCPSLDAIGINTYGGMLKLPETIAAKGWDKAYIVTEFGPRGHWEVAKTPWGLPIEDSSTEKADFYLLGYQHAVQNRPNCLGSYVFLWGHKQEKTHTWYGMFLPGGSPTGAVDSMTYAWTGKWPADRAPRIGPGKFSLTAESGATPQENVFLPGAKLRCKVNAADPEGKALTIKWDLRVDVSDNPGQGGDREPDSVPVDGAVLSSSGSEALIQLPAKPGNYRIFVYARDPGGKAATANVPVLVKQAG